MADPTTQERLSAYYAAEARTLLALSVEKGDTKRLNNNLEQIREGIKLLKAEIANENMAKTSGAPRLAFADFSQRRG